MLQVTTKPSQHALYYGRQKVKHDHQEDVSFCTVASAIHLHITSLFKAHLRMQRQE